MFSRTLRSSNLLNSNSLIRSSNILKLRLIATPTSTKTNIIEQKMGQSTSSELDSSYQFKNYTFDNIVKLVKEQEDQEEISTDSPILVDVREPSELHDYGKIPKAVNIPYKSAPGSLNLNPEEFKELYSVEKPEKSTELIFYCAAGIRAKAAAELAHSFGYTKCSVYPGSFNEWMVRDGPIEKN